MSIFLKNYFSNFLNLLFLKRLDNIFTRVRAESVFLHPAPQLYVLVYTPSLLRGLKVFQNQYKQISQNHPETPK